MNWSIILYIKKRIFWLFAQKFPYYAVNSCRRRGTSGSDFYLLCHKVIYCLQLASAFPIVRDITDTRIHTHTLLHSPWMQRSRFPCRGECIWEKSKSALRLYHPSLPEHALSDSLRGIRETIISSSQLNLILEPEGLSVELCVKDTLWDNTYLSALEQDPLENI